MFFRCFLLLSAINFLSAGRVPQPEERIIGGKNIKIEYAPWQVSLQHLGKHCCGGSIYSKDIIITAAHCRFADGGVELGAEYFQVRVGSSLKSSDGTLIQVEAIISHEEYKNVTNGKDIAVMRLSESLEFSNKVQPIPLAEKNPLPGSLAMASGWGAMAVREDLSISPPEVWIIRDHPEHLRGTRLDIINCREYQDATEDNICVKTPGQSTCTGDSGGPLVVDQQLVGVTSFGPSLCKGFAAFASIPYYRNWILNAIKFI
ncbi:trypsin beta-like [Drosophila ficusphila]|uniref:trypsin beta-like n=1 Tax=Drosophila ficusphila TaxID=30025 RepID=UPI0007E89B4D|nr:trypsin beta-like [Drosophila ficusphila]